MTSADHISGPEPENQTNQRYVFKAENLDAYNHMIAQVKDLEIEPKNCNEERLFIILHTTSEVRERLLNIPGVHVKEEIQYRPEEPEETDSAVLEKALKDPEFVGSLHRGLSDVREGRVIADEEV